MRALRGLSFWIVMAVGGSAAAPRAARAEFLFDFTLGAAFTQPTEVKTEDPSLGISAREDTTIDPSGAFSFRFGGYIDPAPVLGFALDFSHYAAEGGPIEVNNIFPVSPLLLLRAPLLPGDFFPFGVLQPYVGVGPSFVFAHAEVDIPGTSDDVTDSAVDIGLDVRVGVSWLFHPNIGLLVEYRFLLFKQHLKDELFLFDDSDEEAEALFLTHFAMVGVTFRF